MRTKLTYLVLLISFYSFSQTEFEKGYFIKNNSERVDCLIKNEDWKHNPEKFSYKLSENSQVNNASIDNVLEFGIDNNSKYLKTEVDIDVSPNHVSNLSLLKEPVWETRTVFLKVILSGKSSLFSYTSPGLNRFFYNVENGKIIQLIYKRYLTYDNAIKENNAFKQQFYNSYTDCNNLTMNDFNTVKYNGVSLSKLVLAYNDCLNGETVSFNTNKKNVKFNLKFKGGVNIASVNNVTYEFTSSRDVSFGSSIGYRFALESEILLPFNNNKWSFFVEFAKNQKIMKEANARSGSASFSYDSFEAILGARHYLFLANESKISVHLGFTWDLSPDLKLEYELFDGLEGERVSGSFAAGVGYHLDKFSVEARLNFGNNAFEANSFLYTSNFNNFNVTLGYTLF